MHRTRIKICGVTNPVDALAAADAGADAIGMILHAPGAARLISLDTARLIVNVLPPMVTPVGVFVDAAPAEIQRITTGLHLRHVQLHGSESPEDVRALFGLHVTKAIRAGSDLVDQLDSWLTALPILRGLLIESGHGGSGIESNWTLLERARSHATAWLSLSLIAAGGLTAENVQRVVQRLRPFAVDVSSGVEESIGRKSVETMRRFVDAVHRADGSIDDVAQ